MVLLWLLCKIPFQCGLLQLQKLFLDEMFWPPERSSATLPWIEATGARQTPQSPPIRILCTGIENARCLVSMRPLFLVSWGKWWCGCMNLYFFRSHSGAPTPVSIQLHRDWGIPLLMSCTGCWWKLESVLLGLLELEAWVWSHSWKLCLHRGGGLKKGQQTALATWVPWECRAGYNCLCRQEKEIKVESSGHFLWPKVCPFVNCAGLCSNKNQHSSWLCPATCWVWSGGRAQ